ncbi:hypothetical protein CDD82_1077 [Ophiocordyceps australis]|uniref:Uncharacterized protein n=1 Tax=Ophiocordyceps australis TaxID=1399860 RepID=A0A2C5ZUB8_9HYPO|nr:hypothetical protein CDD82_1077 [Ophiocordyceps australis]
MCKPLALPALCCAAGGCCNGDAGLTTTMAGASEPLDRGNGGAARPPPLWPVPWALHRAALMCSALLCIAPLSRSCTPTTPASNPAASSADAPSLAGSPLVAHPLQPS